MRTNIVLNDDLVREAMKYSTATSKRALIEEALVSYVEIKASEQRTMTYRGRLRELERQLRNLRFRESPIEVLRHDRERA